MARVTVEDCLGQVQRLWH